MTPPEGGKGMTRQQRERILAYTYYTPLVSERARPWYVRVWRWLNQRPDRRPW